MKNKELYLFTINIVLLMAPIFSFYLVVDYLITSADTAFNIKSNYIKAHTDIECLFLGSSHTQNGINPDFFDFKTANLAYASQDINIDYNLFKKYIPKLSNLEKVVLEIDYHTLFRRHNKDFFRLPWYYYYHNINVNNQSLLYKYFLYPSNQSFFNNFLKRRYIRKENNEKYNTYGFIINDFHDVFEELRFDSLSIKKTAKNRLKNRHKSLDTLAFKKNLLQIENMIATCNSRGIEVYLLKTPVYITYSENYILSKNEERIRILNYLKKKYEVSILDYEDFLKPLKYYKNDDHLNPLGAKKLSKSLNLRLKK